jgi:RHH-type transcriptional regulator, rel operon repressor / antitoxin RelB
VTGRRRLFEEAQATQEHVTQDDWQIEEINKAVAEADRGDFATNQDVKRTLKKWTRRAG